jgi:ankyrin repeat protein
MAVTRDQNSARIELLFKAIEAGDLNLVKALATLDNQSKRSYNFTPIAVAADLGKKEIVDYLFNDIIVPNLSTNTDLNRFDCLQLTWVVLFAVHRDEFNSDINYLELFIKKLFDHGAKDCSTFYTNSLQNALHKAAQKGTKFITILELLLRHATQEQFNKPDSQGFTPCNYILAHTPNTLRLCIELNLVTNHEILFTAIKNKNLELVKKFATINDQNKIDSYGCTPIAAAARKSTKEIVNYLFNHIIAPNLAKNMALNQNDRLQLGMVVLSVIQRDEFNKDLKYLEKFIHDLFLYGAKSDSFVVETEQTALHITAQKRLEFKNIFGLLIQHAGNEFNKPDKNNKLPIDYAYEKKNAEFVSMLLDWDKKYVISFFILFRSQKLPEELLVIIAGYLAKIDKMAINLLQKTKNFRDYDLILKASCALDHHKKQTKVDEPSIKFFKNIESSLKKNKVQERVSETKNSMHHFLSQANPQCQAVASLKKFGLTAMINHQVNENKDLPSTKKIGI